MVPVLERAADGDAILSELSGAADDVSGFLAQVPGLYFNLGIVPRSQDITKAAPNHSPEFFIDESALVVGVRALAMMAVNYLAAEKTDCAIQREEFHFISVIVCVIAEWPNSSSCDIQLRALRRVGWKHPVCPADRRTKKGQADDKSGVLHASGRGASIRLQQLMDVTSQAAMMILVIGPRL
jgi:hypothetical protein